MILACIAKELPPLKHHYLYRLAAPAGIGIYNEKKLNNIFNLPEFITVMTKKESASLSYELPFQGEVTFGGVIAVNEIEKAPTFKTQDDCIQYLLKWNKSLLLKNEKLELNPVPLTKTSYQVR